MNAPERTTVTGAPCWIDLATSDAERSRAFYTTLFGWTGGESSDEFGGYFMFFKDGAPVAGGMPQMGTDGAPDQWSVYLSVDDARATIESATRHGGEPRIEAMPVADLGVMGALQDPSGAWIGLWQAGTFEGFGTRPTAGAPAWFELLSRDYDASVAFYRDVFGWDAHAMSDTGDFRYTTLGEGYGARAGIMDAPSIPAAEGGGRWSVYFQVDDADAALRTVIDLGGTVVRPAEDTPFGRLAAVMDPTGAAFKLLGTRS